MKILCILFYTIIFTMNIYSQTVQPFVVNVSGGYVQNDKIILDWSLGELAVTTMSTTNNLLSQGFLQPITDPTTGISNDFPKGDIIVYPNPFSSHLYFKTSIPDIANISVFDILGREVLTIEFAYKVDLHQLGYGLYFIALFDKKQQQVRIFKINKI